jgi:gluconate 2-dehydrogenase gamma chain
MKQHNRLTEKIDFSAFLAEWHEQVVTRRRFLQTLAGGTVAAMFPWSVLSDEKPAGMDETRQWQILDTVLQHLLPSESNAPGASEVNALNYFQFIVTDTSIDASEREFITQGVVWLEDMASNMEQTSFIALNEQQREKVLRKIEQSRAGENWLSTLLVYLFEALLADPAYGGNTDGAGWAWLQHIPGYPHPPASKLYPELLKL